MGAWADAAAARRASISAVATFSGGKLAGHETRALTIEDRALFIYTSGTTGLPKAANMNHYRLMLAGHAFAGVMATRPSDRMYDCLPMYHTAGGLVATGAILVSGGSVVIKEKFSAREFWDDIARWNCTIFQYIGEFCRYLLNSPPHPKETAHRLRLACGNGLRPDVWHDFKRRFGIPHIIEFYAATEGNVSLFNFEDKEGAVGRIPWFLESRFPTKVVRFDIDLQQPIRGADGFCIECRPEEAGEVIGKILKDASKPGARFEGYATQVETDKKVLHDVFEKGDSWFRTGDLMRKDADGYFYFVDRIGDTFRWKGENVSTTEVEETIGQFAGRRGDQRLRGRRSRAATAAPAWRPWWSIRASISRPCTSIWTTACRITRGRCSCASAARWTSPAPSSRRRSTTWRRASIRPPPPIRSISTIRPPRASCGSIGRSMSASATAACGCERRPRRASFAAGGRKR